MDVGYKKDYGIMEEKRDYDPSWKYKLNKGIIKTPYRHFTALADGVVQNLLENFNCPAGKAWMGMKTWASSQGESEDMIRVIGADIGFTVTGKVLIYSTEPEEPPQENPYGYDIKFTPYAD